MPQNNLKISSSNYLPSRPVEPKKRSGFNRKNIRKELKPTKIELTNNSILELAEKSKSHTPEYEYFRITHNKPSPSRKPFERTSFIYRINKD